MLISNHICIVFFLALGAALCMVRGIHAEPISLSVFAVSDTMTMSLPDSWIQELPKKQKAYTNYIITQDSRGTYLGIRSGGTGSWIEKDLGEVDVYKTPVMEWTWMVIRLPELEWEDDRAQDDFAIRIELIYDYRGSVFNILNIIRKGFITSLLRGNPTILTISYVWARKVPAGKPYVSPSDRRTIIIPVESGTNISGIWIDENRNILEDLRQYVNDKRIVLKKIRIRSDTDNSLSSAESGLKRIELRSSE